MARPRNAIGFFTSDIPNGSFIFLRFDAQKQRLRSGVPWHFEMPGRFIFSVSICPIGLQTIADFV